MRNRHVGTAGAFDKVSSSIGAVSGREETVNHVP
jgi:hypothetical protein